MEFEWDDEKNRQNIAKHGVSFEEATRIFDGFTVDLPDDRFEYGEAREKSIGLVHGIAMIVVIHTARAGKTRIISARRAIKSERTMYEKAIRKSIDH